MKSNPRRTILVITDKVGGNLTNGSQVMANAVMTELSKGYHLKILVRQQESLPEGMIAEIIQLDPAQDDLEQQIRRLLEQRVSLLYNFGGTEFSSFLTAIVHSFDAGIPIINHFQLLLPEYAVQEGFDREQVTELAFNSIVVAENARYNIFPSFSEMNRVIRLGWQIRDSTICVIRNAYVPAPGYPGPLHDRHRDRHSITFMAAGRFSDYVKGADLLYRAFREYYQSDPNAHLYVAADEQRFIELLDGLPTTAWTWLGWLSREELHVKLKEADVVIVPSRYEPFGLIAVESLALGTPVIAMAIGGLAEIIHHGHTGWLTDPNDGSMGLYRAMRQAAAKKDKLASMGSLASGIVEKEYSLCGMVRDLRKLFDNSQSSAMNGEVAH